MKITFGGSVDGRPFPDFRGEGRGSVGAPVVGPLGLLEVLETQLGLTAPRTPEAVRIATYAANLGVLSGGGLARFWDRSYARDPWETSRLLLRWRDDLRLNGWRGQALGLPRLDDLAAVEVLERGVPNGVGDRLARVLSRLANTPALDIERLTLTAPPERLAPAWRRLLDTLRTCGVDFEVSPARAAGEAGTDLSRVQKFLTSGVLQPLQGDGSVVLVEADTALMAAESVAGWLEAGAEAGLPGTVIFDPARNTALLDGALTARGLPALGQSAASPWRGLLQVLPLAFAIAWKPLNPRALLDLLSLPRPPIGRYAAARLTRAVIEEPGTGAHAWAEAWAAIEARLREPREGEGNRPSDAWVQARLTRWRAWTAGGLFDRDNGITPADARAIAGRVGGWAMEIDAGSGDPLVRALVAACSAFSDAVGALNRERLPAILVERVLSQVLAGGAPNPAHVARAGGLRGLSSSGALWGPAPRLVWWNFQGQGARPPQDPWSRAERATLASAGVSLEPAAAVAERIAADDVDLVLRVQEQLLLVRPALAGSEETIAHPLAHQLEPLLGRPNNTVRWRSERLLEGSDAQFAGRRIARVEVDLLDPPASRARWVLPGAVADRLSNRTESATSLSRLVDCQLRWVLQDVLHLRSGRIADVPGPDQLFGNLAHAIAHFVLPPGPVADPVEIKIASTALFDELLPAIAAPLQQPEHAAELASARDRVPAALESLAAFLRHRRFEVVGTELDREGATAEGMRLKGRLDLVVQDHHGALAVVDLKWTSSSRWYRAQVAEGRAVQLAVYSAIADGDGASAVPGGFYLLNQRAMLAERGSPLAEETIEVSRTLAQTLGDLSSTWSSWRELTVAGVGIAGGVEGAAEAAPTVLALAPGPEPCRFCELTGLCRIHVEAL